MNDDPVVEKFLQQFGARGLPAMMDSAICCVIGSDRPDPKLCLEIGAAVLLDKPLILCLPRGRAISVNLRAAATAIIETEPDGSLTEIQKQEFDRAVTRVMSHDPRVGIECPRCHMRSFNRRDREEYYCGHCHQFHDAMLWQWVYGIIHSEPEPPGDFLRALAEAAVRADPENTAARSLYSDGALP